MPTIHIQIENKQSGPIHVLSRLEARRGQDKMLGDVIRHIFPGHTFFQYTFADLLALGDGAHEVELIIPTEAQSESGAQQ